MNAKKKLSKDSSSEISSLFKLMLIMVEDMKKDHDDKVCWIRKRILDFGNESIRNLDSKLDNYTVTFIFK